MLTFFALGNAQCAMHMGISVGLRRGGNISVDLSLFVLPYDTYFMNKLKFNDFGLTKNEKKFIGCTNTFNLQITLQYFPLRRKVALL